MTDSVTNLMILVKLNFKGRRSTSILCGCALLSTAYVRCHMKMAAAVERQNAARAKDAGWQAFFKKESLSFQ